MRNKEISRKSLKLNRKEEMKFLIICQSKMTLSHFRKRVSIFGGTKESKHRETLLSDKKGLILTETEI